ncbi:hypothetical protein MSIMFB_01767 [Mycobacterium simulans]|uniref:HTH cro/C1-type domain-containing protein n=1 Tax=Mycobacterium simulans TaxID=627089 RepID=A0A7Z7IIT8_9MYCO|nr:helix-turn-helix domain-containing protein [Mycobacterium simulans]SOJ54268.1 hypothetical protein MSIMFB_01767 [Mycobacterium simulans]
MRTIEDNGGPRLKRLTADADRAQRVAVIREGMREADRAYAMNLAMIRQTAELTQVELARRLGVGQAAISKVERQQDLLLSTLASYVNAAGVHARICRTVEGCELAFALSTFVLVDSQVPEAEPSW